MVRSANGPTDSFAKQGGIYLLDYCLVLLVHQGLLGLSSGSGVYR